jgi:hypothetical protein
MDSENITKEISTNTDKNIDLNEISDNNQYILEVPYIGLSN